MPQPSSAVYSTQMVIVESISDAQNINENQYDECYIAVDWNVVVYDLN